MRRGTLVRLGFIAGLLAMLAGGPVGSVLAQDSATFTTTENERLQALAPDGSMVATTTAGGLELCVYTVPNADLVSCVDLKTALIRIDPDTIAWSPDSSSLVFAERIVQYMSDGDIWHVDVQSGELSNLTDDGVADAYPFGPAESPEPFLLDLAPAWSPDGSLIAFTRSVVTGGDVPAPTSVMLLDASTGEVAELALFEEDAPVVLTGKIAWSPDGTEILVSAHFGDPEDDRNGVWAFDAESGGFGQVAGSSDEFEGSAPAVLAVSPRGDKLLLAYPSYVLSASAADKRSGYALLDISGDGPEPIEPAEIYAGDYSVVVGPNFSPDGGSLVFGVRQPSEGAGFIIARDLESGEETILAELPPDVYPIVTYPTTPIQIGGNTAMVLTNLTTAALVELPDELTGPPLLPVEAATPDAEATPVTEIEQIDITLTNGANAAVLREGPSRDDGIIAILQPGAELFRLGNAFEADGHFWIEVMDLESGESGFVRTDFLEPVG